MDRGQKTFAITPLLAILLTATPLLAGRPGERSRQWAKKNSPNGDVQNAVEVRPANAPSAIQQVVGKQPGQRKIDPNRNLFLPPLVGTGNAKPLNTQRSTPSNGTQRPGTKRVSSSSRPASRGLLGELFGDKSSRQSTSGSTRSGSSRAAQNASAGSTPAVTNGTPRTIDWEGIPYHQARSGNHASRAPIRDPRPGEARFTGATPVPRLAEAPPKSILAPSNLPKPPALEPAPTSRTTRRNTSIASARIKREPATPIAVGSSSRRADREDVPGLDASEVAAARTDQYGSDELVPKVSRKRIKVNVEPSDSVASSQRREKPEAKTTTPAVDIAVKASEPQGKPAAPTTSIAATPPTVATPAASPTPTTAPPEPANEPKVASAATPKRAPVEVAASRPSTPPQPAPALPMPATQPSARSMTQPIASTRPAPLPAAITSPNSLSQPPALPLPSSKAVTMQPPQTMPSLPQVAPQSVTPALKDNFTAQQPRIAAQHPSAPTAFPSHQPAHSMPAPPTFNHSIAAHHTGPPANAFSSSFQTSAPRVPDQPLPSPIVGSGVQEPQARVAANPYPKDPYLASPQPYHGSAPNVPASSVPSPNVPAPNAHAPITATPTANPYPNHSMPLRPETAPVYQPRSSQPQPSNIVTTPRASAPSPTAFDPAANSALRENFIPSASDVTNNANRSTMPTPDPASTLRPGTTAVASELPGLRVLTHGPASIVIRETHEFEIRAENRGAIDVSGLIIRAHIPNWAEVKGQNATRGQVQAETLSDSDRLAWKIDSLPAGTTEKLLVRLQAVEAGKHGVDVEWTLLPQKSVATVEVQEPKLELLIEGPDNVVYGESQTYKVRVLNPGDGPAPNVVFTLSPNSPTPQSQRIGDIPSGKEAQFEVELTAQDLGNLKIHGLAAGDLSLSAQAEKTIRVDAAQLEAVLSGPEVKYQNTDGLYALELINHGTATSKNIVATMQLPQGMTYLGGLDDAEHRAGRLTWSVDALPPGAKRQYEFKCKLNEPGEQVIRFGAEGSAAGQATVALDTRVESISDLVMTIQDPSAPAPVGTEVTYEILIKNRGSREARGVRAIAQFSHGIEPRRVQGHPGQVLTGQVLFDPIPSIPAGGEVRIKVMAEAEREGHHRFRTEIRSGETVLVAEEATHYMSKRTERVSRRSESTPLR
ncbi:MAG: hypothetical protein AAFU85_08160 [Planctomycetota bacterium]